MSRKVERESRVRSLKNGVNRKKCKGKGLEILRGDNGVSGERLGKRGIS